MVEQLATLVLITVIFAFLIPAVLKRNASKQQNLEINSNIKTLKIKEEQNYDILNRSLKNLEYINQFEHYMSSEQHTNFSADFLQKFNQLKIEAQLVTLNTTQGLLKQSA